MEMMTAEQAIEAAKGLTFEKVWAALMESRRKSDESIQHLQKTVDDLSKSMDKTMKDLSKNLGGLGNSFGRLTESLFSGVLVKKFNGLGYAFTRQGPHYKFYEDQEVVAEADYWLENGEYVMAVEVKTELSADDVKEHMERLGAIRKIMDDRMDGRKLVGAVAGGMLNENVLKYAQSQGLYVIVISGETAAIAKTPKGFIAREW